MENTCSKLCSLLHISMQNTQIQFYWRLVSVWQVWIVFFWNWWRFIFYNRKEVVNLKDNEQLQSSIYWNLKWHIQIKKWGGRRGASWSLQLLQWRRLWALGLCLWSFSLQSPCRGLVWVAKLSPGLDKNHLLYWLVNHSWIFLCVDKWKLILPTGISLT